MNIVSADDGGDSDLGSASKFYGFVHVGLGPIRASQGGVPLLETCEFSIMSKAEKIEMGRFPEELQASKLIKFEL